MVIVLSHHAVKAVGERLGTIRRLMANNFNRVYRAHETTAVDPFAIVLLCGDIRYDVSPCRPFILPDLVLSVNILPAYDLFRNRS
jgi:hypothetical protein